MQSLCSSHPVIWATYQLNKWWQLSLSAGKLPSAISEVTELWNTGLGDVEVWAKKRRAEHFRAKALSLLGESNRMRGTHRKGKRRQRRVIQSCKRSPMTVEMLACVMNGLRELRRVPGCHVFPWFCPAGPQILYITSCGQMVTHTA